MVSSDINPVIKSDCSLADMCHLTYNQILSSSILSASDTVCKTNAIILDWICKSYNPIALKWRNISYQIDQCR